jgi:hypothetical protein
MVTSVGVMPGADAVFGPAGALLLPGVEELDELLDLDDELQATAANVRTAVPAANRNGIR